jgi:arylsulfatase A-like enzyme
VSPVCSPARASLLTGRIPSQHGVHDWLRAGNSTSEPERGGRLIEYLAGLPGYTDLLADEGYVCGMSGKWHLGDAHHRQKGFTFWRVHARAGGDYYGAPMVADEAHIRFEPRYCTDVFTDNALAFLEEQARTYDPFYLSLHYTAPHRPWGRDQHPPEYFEKYYSDCAFDSVPDVPKHPNYVNPTNFFDGPAARREALSGYYAAVEAMDANVGRLLDWLERHDLRENTLVFFTSDNGMNMGHHGICGKGNGTDPLNMFETSVKVPTIISRPGYIPTGVVAEGLFSHYDWMPTLLDYLGLDNPVADALPGRSFAPLLEGDKAEGQGAVVVFDEYGPTRMIRDRAWKYVHRYPDGPHELYDLANDSDEQNDLYGAPEHQARVAAMRDQLDTWFDRYVVAEMDGTKHPISGRGQYAPPPEGPDAFAQAWVQEGEWWGEDIPVVDEDA